MEWQIIPTTIDPSQQEGLYVPKDNGVVDLLTTQIEASHKEAMIEDIKEKIAGYRAAVKQRLEWFQGDTRKLCNLTEGKTPVKDYTCDDLFGINHNICTLANELLKFNEHFRLNDLAEVEKKIKSGNVTDFSAQLWQCLNKWRNKISWKKTLGGAYVFRLILEKIVLSDDNHEKHFGDWQVIYSPQQNFVTAEYIGPESDRLKVPGAEHFAHPHVEGNKICFGGASNAIKKALSNCSIYDLFCITEATLRSYFRGGAYKTLRHFHTQEEIDKGAGSAVCAKCGETEGVNEQCSYCDYLLCDSCAYICSECEGVRCEGCMVEREDGGQICHECFEDEEYHYCEDCSVATQNSCSVCGMPHCEHHMYQCSDCSEAVCGCCCIQCEGCGATVSSVCVVADEDGEEMCPNCYEESLKEREADNEASTQNN